MCNRKRLRNTEKQKNFKVIELGDFRIGDSNGASQIKTIKRVIENIT